MLTHTITLNFLRKVTIGYTTVHPAAKSDPTDPETNVSLGDQISCSLFATKYLLIGHPYKGVKVLLSPPPRFNPLPSIPNIIVVVVHWSHYCHINTSMSVILYLSH